MTMTDNAFATIPICAIALICVALVGIIGYLLLRFTGRGITSLLGGGLSDMVTGATGADELDAYNRPSRRSRRPNANDLRANAQALDFDAAVQRHRGGAASSPLGADASPDEYGAQSVRQRRRRNEREESEDDIEDDALGDGF